MRIRIRKIIYFTFVLIMVFLCFKYFNKMKDNKKIKDETKKEEVIFSDETLRELDSLNKSIEEITAKDGSKFGPVIEIKIKDSVKKIKNKKSH
jgi:regulatory protein YycI of two-component signal transduction system YycFG